MLAAACVILAIYVISKIYQSATGAPDKRIPHNSGTGLSQFLQENIYPYKKVTPLRKILWERYTHDGGVDCLDMSIVRNLSSRNRDFFALFYLIFSIHMLNFLSEPLEKIFGDKAGRADIRRLDTEEVFLYVLPYYYMALCDKFSLENEEVISQNQAVLNYFDKLLWKCKTQFLKDYSTTYNISYDEIMEYDRIKMGEYAVLIESTIKDAVESGEVSNLRSEGCEPTVRVKMVDDLMANVLHSSDTGIREVLLFYTSLNSISQLPKSLRDIELVFGAIVDLTSSK